MNSACISLKSAESVRVPGAEDERRRLGVFAPSNNDPCNHGVALDVSDSD